MPGTRPAKIVIGRILKAQGVNGEVKVQPLTDYPPRFKHLKSVSVETPDDNEIILEVARVSLKGDTVHLAFATIATREAAEALQGSYIKVDRQHALPLDNDAFYPFEVEGFEVRLLSGRRLGTVSEILDLPANAVLVVNADEREYLIPLIKDVVHKIDKKGHRFIINPIVGLLE